MVIITAAGFSASSMKEGAAFGKGIHHIFRYGVSYQLFDGLYPPLGGSTIQSGKYKFS
ncbi:MAG: hypothetical protein XD50_1744 [Clostridia bacterium 41_269]|nr:MAG: hypothetical protein XD50_1744 [Clostridia bacterium 41_269]